MLTVKIRYLIALAAFCGLFLNNSIKNVTNITLVAISDSVKPSSTNQTGYMISSFPIGSEYNESFPSFHESSKIGVDWNAKNRNRVQSWFFYGYVLLQLPSGRLSEVIGTRMIFGPAIFLASILSFIFPFAARKGPTETCAIRFLQGMCLGVSFPSIHSLLSRWSPINERSRMLSFIYSGSSLGLVAIEVASGYVSSTELGWPFIYYITGGCGLIWSCIWIVFFRNNPEKYLFMKESELAEINFGRSKGDVDKKPSLPIKSIIRTKAIYAMVFSVMVGNWAHYLVVVEQPEYLANILKIDIRWNGILCSLPNLFYTGFSFIFASLCDRMRRSNRYSITTLRKIFNSIGLFGMSFCLLLIPLAGRNVYAVNALFIAATTMYSANLSGVAVNHIELSPTFAGTLMGITNCLGNFPGFFVPMTTSSLVPNSSDIHAWARLFYFSSGLSFLGGVGFLLFSTSKLQKWDPEFYNKNKPSGELKVDIVKFSTETNNNSQSEKF